jgi:hypothetical protein
MNRQIRSKARHDTQRSSLASSEQCHIQLDNQDIAEPSAVAPDARVNFAHNHRRYQIHLDMGLGKKESPRSIGLIPIHVLNVLLNTEVDSSIRRYRARFCHGATYYFAFNVEVVVFTETKLKLQPWIAFAGAG